MDSAATLNIRLLGGFAIEYGGKTADESGNRSKKLWRLLGYLITFRGNVVTQNELIEILWSDESSPDPANTLKALLHRARNQLTQLGLNGKQIIEYKRGGYTWNNEGINTVIDAEEFEKYCRLAEEAGDDSEKLEHLLRALSIYRGDYLPETAFETWAVAASSYFHIKYKAAFAEALALLEKESRHEDIIALCQKSLQIDAYDEATHIAFIRALANRGQVFPAIAHYEYVSDMLYTYFGTAPSPEFTALYKEIASGENLPEQDFAEIREGLETDFAPESGAYMCEMVIFREICRNELRAQLRTGQLLCLCLISVAGRGGESPTQKQLAEVMKRLENVIRQTLRMSDTFTRYSATQFLALLPGTKLEDADTAFERILKQYRRENAYIPVEVRHRLHMMSAESVLMKDAK